MIQFQKYTVDEDSPDKGNKFSVVYTVYPEDVTLEELLGHFEQFLQSIGYSIKIGSLVIEDPDETNPVLEL